MIVWFISKGGFFVFGAAVNLSFSFRTPSTSRSVDGGQEMVDDILAGDNY